MADVDFVLEELLAIAGERNEAAYYCKDLPRYVDVACRAEHDHAHMQRKGFDPVLDSVAFRRKGCHQERVRNRLLTAL